MYIDTWFLRRCVDSLELAITAIENLDAHVGVSRDEYQSACVKYFELVLEKSGKLLRKRSSDYVLNNRQIDALMFNPVFRHAARLDTQLLKWRRSNDGQITARHITPPHATPTENSRTPL